jgi:hypothetical protein
MTPLASSSQEGISGKKRGRKRRVLKPPIFLTELGVHAPSKKQALPPRKPLWEPGFPK